MHFLATKILEVADSNKPQLPPETLILGTGNAMQTETQQRQQQTQMKQREEEGAFSDCCS
jgi:hypothetical protein